MLKISAVRIMSYNIRSGEGMDGKFDLNRTAAAINMQKSDIVGIQEGKLLVF